MQQRIYLFSLLFFFVITSAVAQEGYRVSGYVKDSTDGKPIIKAAIVVDFQKSGTYTDEKGYYSILLPYGKHTIAVRHVGYRVNRAIIDLQDNLTLSFSLNSLNNELDEVIVTSKAIDENVQRPLLGVSQLSIKVLKKIPAAFGETDILRGLQMLPGVTSVGEAANGVNIRGGTTDQNLILLDDAPIFNPTHMFGLFSVFPPDAVSNVELYKGSAPARFGGRAAAVMDISLSNPSLDKFKMTGGLSPVSSRVSVDIPLIKERMGVMVAGRGSFNDFLLPIFTDRLNGVKTKFGDVSLKWFYRLNNKNTFTLSSYFSKDFFQTGLLGTIGNINATSTQYAYQTLNLSARWFHAINNKLNIQTSLVSSDYVPKILLPELNSSNKVEIAQGIQYRQLKSNFNYLKEKHKIEGGLSAIYYHLNPGELKPGSSPSVNAVKTPVENSLELGIYLEDEVTVSPKLTISAGLRYSEFLVLGPANVLNYRTGEPLDEASVRDTTNYGSGKIITTYGGFEPRLGLRYAVNDNLSFKAGYNLMRQYMQVVTNTTTPLPTSRWKTSDTHIKPQVSHLLTAGLFRNSQNGAYEFSLEGYYRNTNNIIDYKPGADFLLQAHPETQLLQGKNKSYGIELMLTKKRGEVTGWVNYTYSRSLNQVYEGPSTREQVNFGNWYPANYDRPHNFNATITINQGKHHDFAFTFSYSTGRPYTSPQGFIRYQGQTFPFYNERNQDRIPDYHRLDFSWNIYQPSMKNRRWQGHWTFTVFNLYGRANAYSIFYRSNGSVLNAYKLTIFAAPIPTLTYNFKFM
ncbi:MAG: TonB-dependent receptor [Spirosomataceae bacterium]